jgi:hypothetical protein
MHASTTLRTMASNMIPSSLLQLTLPPAALKQSSEKKSNNKLHNTTNNTPCSSTSAAPARRCALAEARCECCDDGARAVALGHGETGQNFGKHGGDVGIEF